MLQVHAIGTKVLLGNAEEHFEGSIIRITISADNYTQYEIAWWSGKSRETKFMHDSDFKLIEPGSNMAIGFHTLMNRCEEDVA